MATTVNFFDFNTAQTIEDFWDFVGQDSASTGLKNNGGYWNNINNGSTASRNTGPDAGQNNDGYIYVETSSPCNGNAVFTMTSKAPINAAGTTFTIDYWYCCNTDAPVTCDVQFWDGFQWNTEDTITPLQADLGVTWYNRTVTVDTYTNADCLIRFQVSLPNTGTTYQKDFALDTITLTTVTEDDPVVNELASLGISTKWSPTFKKLFRAVGMSSAQVKTTLQSVLANINTYDFTKYKRGIVIKEDGNIVHVITEKDKGN